MSKNKLTFIIGLLVAVMPVLGFPPKVETIFYIVAGIILMIIAFYSYFQRKNQVSPL